MVHGGSSSNNNVKAVKTKIAMNLIELASGASPAEHASMEKIVLELMEKDLLKVNYELYYVKIQFHYRSNSKYFPSISSFTLYIF